MTADRTSTTTVVDVATLANRLDLMGEIYSTILDSLVSS